MINKKPSGLICLYNWAKCGAELQFVVVAVAITTVTTATHESHAHAKMQAEASQHRTSDNINLK